MQCVLGHPRSAPSLYSRDIQFRQGHSGQHRRPVQAGGQARSVIVGNAGRVGEHGESGVEAALGAPIGLMVGFGGDESDQLVQFVIGGGQGGAVTVSARAEHEPFTVARNCTSRSVAAVSSQMMISLTAPASLSCRRRRLWAPGQCCPGAVPGDVRDRACPRAIRGNGAGR
jgi:hypothetical protein